MTFNLIEGIDVAAIEVKIAEYQEENAEQIMINRARKAEELAAALAASKGKPAQTDNDVVKYRIVNDTSEEDFAADGMLERSGQTKVAEAADQNSHAEGVGGVPQGQYAPTFAGQPRPTGMAPQPLPLGGGGMLGYAADDEETMRLRAERGPGAGGWSPQISKKRALEEAFGTIWVC
ncbi:hypothetical protein Lal_00027596 [Lupinus albus]|nr:hypothetical protein Lal_00027596 [Lupinus albus]